MKVQQEKGSKDLLLFSASAVEIDRWVGIPQRLNLKGNETAGFQRTVSRNREDALRKFFAEDRNVIQNPLLCAIRQAPGVEVTFSEIASGDDLGYVDITFPDYNEKSLLELLREARHYLEDRASFLKDRVLPADVLSNLQEQMPAEITPIDQTSEEDWPGDATNDDDTSETAEPAEEALFDESQITDFWDQLRVREEIIGKLEDANTRQELLGFSRQILESYLRPVILVDGQHRLRGAVLAASDEVNNSNDAEDMILDGQSVRQAKESLLVSRARKLPVSLLMDESPAEHVFQYVLVNQKATPVPRALLGTII
ncbi:hypothetical protein, partial [Streptomyces sp. NPDC051577]|uniref:hypothetical protein n=1 Tax=Streptomyces sp. NPDC051577 TaxID=3155166 RepID=UPI003426E056